MDTGELLTAVAALGFVLGLIVVLAWAVRRLNLVPGVGALKRGARRLAVVETTPIDVRHKLVLVRRDGAEHLLLLGAQNDLVVEAGIAPPPAEPAP